MTRGDFMKLAVVGDSYALPRLKKDSDEIELFYDDVYPEKLRKMLVKSYPNKDILLLNCSKHANTSVGLVRGAANEVYFLQPDYVIIQLGMVDLWPAAGRNIPPPYADLVGKDTWVSKEEFKNNIDRFLRFCFSVGRVKYAILINIPRISIKQYEKYPLTYERTKEYNEIINLFSKSSKVKLVDAYSILEQLGERGIGSDGIHPTAEASSKIAQSLFAVINSCTPN